VTTTAPTPSWRRVRRIVTGVGVVLILVVAVGLGAGFFIEVPVLLLLGWIAYVVNVLPRVRPNWSAIASFVFVLAVLFAAGHPFLVWFCARMTPPRTWRPRETAAALGLLFALFATSMATTGIAHQAGWLAQTGEPLVQNSWQEWFDHSRTARVCQTALAGAVDKRFVLDKLPASDADVRIVPLGVEGEGAAEVLIIARDPGGVKTRAGVLCAPDGPRKLSADRVADELKRTRVSASR